MRRILLLSGGFLALLFMLGSETSTPVKAAETAPGSLTQKQHDILIGAPETELREIKVQVRELANQLLETFPGNALLGKVVFASSFVNLNNTHETSSLGRYIPEAMVYEFNTRSLPVYRYHPNDRVNISKHGQISVSNGGDSRVVKDKNALFLTGTYLKDPAGFIVNARLINDDGLIVRTGQIILPMNGLVARMTAKTPNPYGRVGIVGK